MIYTLYVHGMWRGVRLTSWYLLPYGHSFRNYTRYDILILKVVALFICYNLMFSDFLLTCIFLMIGTLWLVS